MKIVKRGKEPKNRVYRGTCHGCKSVMEETEGNLSPEYDQREKGSFAHAVCPVCGHNFVMYPKQ